MPTWKILTQSCRLSAWWLKTGKGFSGGIILKWPNALQMAAVCGKAQQGSSPLPIDNLEKKDQTWLLGATPLAFSLGKITTRKLCRSQGVFTQWKRNVRSEGYAQMWKNVSLLQSP